MWTAASAAAVTALAGAALRRTLPGGSARWNRVNHRGEPISLTEGPALAAGLTVAALRGPSTGRARCAAAIATLGGGAFGLVDDLAETTASKGLRGHFASLRRGELTTGALKVLGIGTAALVAAAIAGPQDGERRSATRRLMTIGLDGALIAGSANLANLFDLRPGRVLKVAALTATPLAAMAHHGATDTTALGILAASAAAVPGDLGERSMAGDCGANALGALIGFTATRTLCPAARIVALGSVIGRTVASEKVSFSSVIDATPALRAVDRWGRRA